jgi:hypothetical protein
MSFHFTTRKTLSFVDFVDEYPLLSCLKTTVFDGKEMCQSDQITCVIDEKIPYMNIAHENEKIILIKNKYCGNYDYYSYDYYTSLQIADLGNGEYVIVEDVESEEDADHPENCPRFYRMVDYPDIPNNLFRFKIGTITFNNKAKVMCMCMDFDE